MASQSFFNSRGFSEEAACAQVLLQRYPQISEKELANLIHTFSQLPLLDFGLLAANERLAVQLDAFYADHGDKLRPTLSVTEWALAVSFVIGVVVLIFSFLG